MKNMRLCMVSNFIDSTNKIKRCNYLKPEHYHSRMSFGVFTLIIRTLRNITFLDRVLYAKKTGDEEDCAATVLGGEKITVEEACVS